MLKADFLRKSEVADTCSSKRESNLRKVGRGSKGCEAPLGRWDGSKEGQREGSPPWSR